MKRAQPQPDTELKRAIRLLAGEAAALSVRLEATGRQASIQAMDDALHYLRKTLLVWKLNVRFRSG